MDKSTGKVSVFYAAMLILSQTFARKVLHLFSLEPAEVQNEIRAITKLCDGRHKNIIEVFRHGEFHDSSHAYIDMELCTVNLEDYNRSNWVVAKVSQQFSSSQRALEMW